jgi:hypothetical protein
MTKQSGGSLPRGRRRRNEVPPVPEAAHLSPLEADAQRALRELVESVGGRFDSQRRIPVGHIDTLARLFDAWARRHAESSASGLYFDGHPGLWHALDELYPLQDPNRWDPLRQAVIAELETNGWRRRKPPRGIAFDIPE